MNEIAADDILKFWFEEIEHSSWFRKDPDFDRELGRRFGDVLTRAKNDQLDHWCASAHGSLALIVILDQFSRNLFRESPKAFDADPKALKLCLDGIEKRLDLELTLEQRSFYYLPLRHAEDLAMQELGLTKTRELNAAGYGTEKYALNHLEIVQQFGRFPHRNEVLGRANTPAEELYLADGNAGF